MYSFLRFITVLTVATSAAYALGWWLLSALVVAIVGAALGCSSTALAQEVSTKNEHVADGIDVCVYRSAKTPTKNAPTVSRQISFEGFSTAPQCPLDGAAWSSFG